MSLLGFLDGNVEFTPLEDRIGIDEIIIDKGVGEKSYAFCIQSHNLNEKILMIMRENERNLE